MTTTGAGTGAGGGDTTAGGALAPLAPAPPSGRSPAPTEAPPQGALAPPAAAPSPVPAKPVPPEPGAPAGESGGAQEEQRRGVSRSWVSRLLRGDRAAPVSPEPPDAPSRDTPDAPGSFEATGRPGPETPWQPPASREEEQRRVQAEVDRREARRNRTRADTERAEQLARLVQEEKEARETDAFRSTELRNQLDALAAQEQHSRELVAFLDRQYVDPWVQAALPGQPPEAQRAWVEAQIGEEPDVLAGRQKVIKAAQAALEARVRQDEANKLRRSAAFRKQVLSDARTTPGDDLAPTWDEPELLTGRNGRAPSSPNDWLRAQLTGR